MSEELGKSTWQPFSKAELISEVAAGESLMDAPLRSFWERVRIAPVKWALPPWGDQGGGFWVVGIIGQQVVWFNDIEEGFNRSHYESIGVIGVYWCNQDELQHCLHRLFAEFNGESGEAFRLGPPEPIPPDSISD